MREPCVWAVCVSADLRPDATGGGFCSCRTLGDDAPLGLPAAMSALLVDATGDGQRHKLTLHTADSWAMSVPTWAADFIPGKRTTHRLPLASFVPSIRGRVLKVNLSLTLTLTRNPHPSPKPHQGLTLRTRTLTPTLTRG